MYMWGTPKEEKTEVGNGTAKDASSASASSSSGSSAFSSPVDQQSHHLSSPEINNLEGQSHTETHKVLTPPTAEKAAIPGRSMPPPMKIESLAWKNISYYYKSPGRRGVKQQEKAAVKNCTGLVKRGDMVAVMGPSGAGKSSLFDVLARRIGSSGRLEGQMYVNGATIDDKTFMRISEYVQHEDVFVATQTLSQALEYHSNLRLGPHVAMSEKRARIDRLVHEAGLSEKMNTRIGGILAGGITIKGLSNGEKRRVSVVCAAIANPSILFLDEPTSGLDSFAALKVMEMMAKFCAEGRLIVCTIHQPRSQVYELFNKVLILSKGELVYFGGSTAILDWFDTKLHRHLPRGTSIPDFVLDLVNVSFEEDPHLLSKNTHILTQTAAAVTEKKNPLTLANNRLPSTHPQPHTHTATAGPVNVEEAAALFRDDISFKALVREIDGIVSHAHDNKTEKDLILRATNGSHKEHNWWYKFSVVFGRNLRFYLANPGNVLVRLLISVTVGIFQGVVFFRAPEKTPVLVQSVSLLICLFVTQLQALLLPFVSMTLFIEDRKFFVRESASRLYSTSNYFLANALLELLLTTSCAVIYGVLTYFLCFYTDHGDFAFDPVKFAVYLAFVVAGAHTGSMQAIMCSILSPSLEIACALNVGITCVFCFGGIPPRLLFPPSRIIQWVSPLKYSYTAMVESYFRGTASQMYVDMMDVTEPSGVGINLACLAFFFVAYNVISFVGLDKLYRSKH